MAIICPEHKLMFIMVPGTGCTAVGQVLQKRLDGQWFPSKDLFQDNKKIPYKHTSLREIIKYKLMTEEELDEYLIFATIRNPFDRVTTLYQRLVGDWSGTRLEKRKKESDHDELSQVEKNTLKRAVNNKEKEIKDAKEMQFENWLEQYLNNQINSKVNKNRNTKRKDKTTSWLELLVDPDKMSILYPLVQGCDRIIYFESLEEDFNQLLKEAEIIQSDEWIDIPKTNPTQGKKSYQEYYSERSRSFMEENFSRELAVFGYQFDQGMSLHHSPVRLQAKNPQELPSRNARAYAKLARVMLKQGQLQESIANFQKAITLQPEQPTWVYLQLGNALRQNDQVSAAIAIYEKAIKLQPNIPNFYLKVAPLYAQESHLDSAINSYEQAIRLKPDLHSKVDSNLAKLRQQQGRKNKAVSVLPTSNEGNERENYSKIWKALNEISWTTLYDESSQYPIDIDQQAVKQYFEQVSQYKIINLTTSLTNKDKSFIENAGLSLTYLNLNRGLVTQEEALDNNSLERQQDEHLIHQKLIADKGCVYAVCPSTGKILQSNRSVFINMCFYYRFVGQEVFYLIFGGKLFQKGVLYFPRLDLLVYLNYKKLAPHLKGLKHKKKGGNLLKEALVAHWSLFRQYFDSIEPCEAVALVGLHFSIHHHILNELSGIAAICKSECLNQIDKFIVIGPEYYGGIDEIFPEIPSDKVQRFNYWRTTESTSWKTRGLVFEEASREILKSNYFAFKLGDHQVSDDLRHRIHQVSLRKCSSDFLAQVEAAKKNYCPLLWISFRTHFRIWLSQVEGIAHIVNTLSEHFPNLAVVFDGYTRIDINGNLLISEKDEEIIQNEKNAVSQIQSLFTQKIKVYNIIGSPMYEVIVWANAIDLYLVPGGSTATKMTWVVKKPGFLHSNRTIQSNLSKNETLDFPQEGERGTINYSYDFDWKIAYEKLFNIASSIKRDE